MLDSLSYIGRSAVRFVVKLPLGLSKIPCGFPSAAEDWIEAELDLNEKLIKSPPSTFLFRVEGESMKDAGINDGDLLNVDRAKSPLHGKIVVAVVGGEMTVKRLNLKSEPPRLEPANLSVVR